MKDWWKIALFVVCALLGVGLILLASRPPRGQAIRLSPPPTSAPVVVHVAGAVARPGLYNLPAGSRVDDAIQAAGGLTSQANPGALNLALILEDGQRVYVPTQPPDSPSTSAPGALPATPGINSPININTASQTELETLPGIGPVTAQKIIAYRQTNGPFASIEAIQDVPGIGPKTFENIKHLITVDLFP